MEFLEFTARIRKYLNKIKNIGYTRCFSECLHKKADNTLDRECTSKSIIKM